MANFFKLPHSNGTATLINLDLLESVFIKKNTLTFTTNSRSTDLDFSNKNEAEKVFNKINDYFSDDNYDNRSDDEKLLYKRIDQLLDLISEKEEEIKNLKEKNKNSIMNKINNIIK